jgi:hypothetical protein
MDRKREMWLFFVQAAVGYHWLVRCGDGDREQGAFLILVSGGE